ncbi:hypothetical protein HYFRA_00005247 [Hymenoscyphus fraxineus]|uniref:Uncharacterized protein n=1 Tax=Hymenoscyphus fraxineus TaxID=746836 RepID=A0A9N9Q083_9HELO|nr:hypothetical protein HYFRA_00005247 [Hymenoscyphus fraxineus]
MAGSAKEKGTPTHATSITPASPANSPGPREKDRPKTPDQNDRHAPQSSPRKTVEGGKETCAPKNVLSPSSPSSRLVRSKTASPLAKSNKEKPKRTRLSSIVSYSSSDDQETEEETEEQQREARINFELSKFNKAAAHLASVAGSKLGTTTSQPLRNTVGGGEGQSTMNTSVSPALRNNSTVANTDSTPTTTMAASSTEGSIQAHAPRDSQTRPVANPGSSNASLTTGPVQMQTPYQPSGTTISQGSRADQSVRPSTAEPTQIQSTQSVISNPNNSMDMPPQAVVTRVGREPSGDAPLPGYFTTNLASSVSVTPINNPQNGSSLNEIISNTHAFTLPPGIAMGTVEAARWIIEEEKRKLSTLHASAIASGARPAPRTLHSAPSTPDRNPKQANGVKEFAERWRGWDPQRQMDILKLLFQNTKSDIKGQVITLAKEFMKPTNTGGDNMPKDTHRNQRQDNGTQTSTDPITVQSIKSLVPNAPATSKSLDREAMMKADEALIDAVLEAEARKMKKNPLKRSRYNFELDEEEDVWEVDEVIEKRVRHEYFVSFKNRGLEAQKWVTANSWPNPREARRKLEEKAKEAFGEPVVVGLPAVKEAFGEPVVVGLPSVKEAFGEPVVAGLPSVKDIPEEPLRATTPDNPRPTDDSEIASVLSGPSSLASPPTKRRPGRPRKDSPQNTKNENSTPVTGKRPRGRPPKNQMSSSASTPVIQKEPEQPLPKSGTKDIWEISDDSS